MSSTERKCLDWDWASRRAAESLGAVDAVHPPEVPEEVAAQPARARRPRRVQRDVYMINVNQTSGSVFVKDLEFFRSQGGFKQEWGTHWVPIVATSIEDARERGCKLDGARPYDQQAKP